MSPDPEQREIKRELRQLNARLRKISSRISLIFFTTFLLPLFIAIGAGFYYAGGVDYVKQTYRNLIENDRNTNSDSDGNTEEKKPPAQEDQSSSETPSDADEPSGTNDSSSSSGDSTEDDGSEAGWNPGGEETEKAKRRQEGFEEKSPVDED